jgi:predicted nicotinamide N-methyase
MTPLIAELSDLAGADLVDALERRFETVVSDVDVGDRTFSLLRPRNSDDLIREEDFVKDERLPYWADIWPSSTILAAHLVELSKKPGRKVSASGLELGCGLGLVTTAAMIAGYDMLATDYYTDALAFTRANAWTNTGRSPDARMIDWRHFPANAGKFDLILASDVLYERTYAELIPGIVKKSLKRGGMAIIADPGRIGVPDFLEECEAMRLEIRSKVTIPFESGEIRQQIDLYELGDAAA